MLGPTFRSFITSLIEFSLSQALSSSASNLEKLKTLDGHNLCIEIKDFDTQFVIYFDSQDTRISWQTDEEEKEEQEHNQDSDYDIRLSGNLKDFLSLATQKNHSLADSGIIASGSIGLLEKLQNTLTSLDIDWEELIYQKLETLAPDLDLQPSANLALAPLSFLFKQGKEKATYSFHSVSNQINEYLRFESGLIVSKQEFEKFANQTNQVRQSVERLEAKLNAFLSNNSTHKK